MAVAWQSTLATAVPAGGILAENVAKSIADAIAVGLIAEGEQLPSESDLSAQLSISTVTLRTALMILRQQGLIETRRGRHGGSFVRRSDDASAQLARARFAQLELHDLRDLGDELVAIASMSARLAARRRDGTNLSRMRALTAELAASADASGARLSSRFHIEVAVASKSERLTRRTTILQAEHAEFLWLPEARPDRAAAIRDHERLIAAIDAEDADAAGRLAETHATSTTARLIAARDTVERP